MYGWHLWYTLNLISDNDLSIRIDLLTSIFRTFLALRSYSSGAYGIWICFFSMNNSWVFHGYCCDASRLFLWFQKPPNELSMNNSLLFLARADKILNHELLMNSSWIVHGSENRFYTMNSSWFTHEQFMVMNFRKAIF